MRSLEAYRTLLEDHMTYRNPKREPQNLYEPVSYILSLGGKRLRPVLTLLTAEALGGTAEKALDAALAVEIFHNFSLVHDDIMDDAPLRRGQATVHEKWDINTGILSGDAMLILAYRLFESYDPPVFRELARLFSKTALEVCEGQQYDVDFAGRNDVSLEEYLVMIRYKTAVLLGAAMEMGAIIANSGTDIRRAIYEFGTNLGIAFQLKDDHLDVFGDPESFGKQPGGDIVENKKTFLYIKSLALSTSEEAKRLNHWYRQQPANPSEKIEEVTSIMISSGAKQASLDAIASYTQKALSQLDTIPVSPEAKTLLQGFAQMLMDRKV